MCDCLMPVHVYGHGVAARLLSTHSGQMNVSKPVSQQNQEFANSNANKRPLATSTNRPLPAARFTASLALQFESVR